MARKMDITKSRRSIWLMAVLLTVGSLGLIFSWQSGKEIAKSNLPAASSAPSMSAPAQPKQIEIKPKILNNCASQSTGVIRPSYLSTCRIDEWPIGATALTPGSIRPTEMDIFFANRIKVAQFLGEKKGHQLQITSGWRSLDYQQKLFENAIERHGSVSEASKWVLPPQDSMHPWGLAVDINYGVGKKSGAEWLETTGFRFGLCRRYENEWWHFEPLVAPGQSCPALELYPVALSGIE